MGASGVGDSAGGAARGRPADVTPVALFVLVAVAAGAACESRPPSDVDQVEVNPPLVVGSDTLPAEEVRSQLASHLGFTSRGGRVFCSYTMLGGEGDRVFLEVTCEEWVRTADSLESGSATGGPVAIVLDTVASPPRIAGHQVPRDGSLHGPDIRTIFPESIQQRMRSRSAEAVRTSADLRAANRAAAAADASPG